MSNNASRKKNKEKLCETCEDVVDNGSGDDDGSEDGAGNTFDKKWH
jgi:hypothetical protein